MTMMCMKIIQCFFIFCPRFAFSVVRADSLVLEGPSPVMLAKGIIIFEVFHIVIQ